MEKVHIAAAALAAAGILRAAPAPAAEPVLVRCGREYQAARSAGTLNGADWNAYRVACAERVKAGAAAPTPAGPAAALPAAVPIDPPAAPATPAASSAPAPSAGMAAMHARQKQCGAEWTAAKATLVAATPGLTWPRYWSQCNARLKAAAGAPGAPGR